MDKVKKVKDYINTIIKYIFIKDEYEIKFGKLLIYSFRTVYLICVSVVVGFRLLLLLGQQISTGFNPMANFINFLICVMLIYPGIVLIKFIVNIVYKGDILFKNKTEIDLKRFCYGNKFVISGYKPDIRFSFDNDFLIIKFRLDGHQISRKFLTLEQQLKDMLVLQMDNFKNEDGFAIYTFRRKPFDPGRISIRDVENEDSQDTTIKINDEVSWNFRRAPHMLINGGTGGGKTFFLIYLIRVLLEMCVVPKILDPKRSVLNSLRYYGYFGTTPPIR
jgi:hypothetical protein